MATHGISSAYYQWPSLGQQGVDSLALAALVGRWWHTLAGIISTSAMSEQKLAASASTSRICRLQLADGPTGYCWLSWRMPSTTTRTSKHASIDIIRNATSSTLAPLDRSNLRDARPFYEGRHREELLAEYGIETTQKQLQPLLPLRILNDQPCPGCGAPLQQKWATKTYGLPPASASPVAISSSVFAPVGTACASDSSVQTESGLISGCRSHSFASNTKYCLCHCC